MNTEQNEPKKEVNGFEAIVQLIVLIVAIASIVIGFQAFL
jgi:hypothetical protein